MPTTPLLAITQVSASQNSKETTINDAIIALEDATNRSKAISFAATTSYVLTATEATRNFIYRAQSATASSELVFPIAINGAPYNRVFAVRNESGQQITVKYASGAGTTVIVPNGQTRLIAALDGINMIVAAEPESAISFVSLPDAPATLVGAYGKFLSVNLAENRLEFVDAAVFPAYAANAGKALVVNATEDGVEWVAIETITSFLALTDTPNTYAGSSGKIAAVKDDETGIEFIDLPPAEAVEFVSADQWRIRVITPGGETRMGFGEIEFQDQNGIDQATGGSAFTSNFEIGREPALAFDGNLSAGAGWRTEESFVGTVTIGYDMPVAKTIRTVRLWPISGFPTFTPQSFAIEFYNGTTWIEAGVRTASTWVDGVPQSFAVNGFPLQSVSDAPSDGVPYIRRNAAWENANEAVLDIVGAALDNGTGLTASFDDATDSLSFDLDPATLAEIHTGANAAKAITPDGMYDAAATVALTDGATITINGNTGINFSVTLGGNRTLANPTNMKPGQSGMIIVTQDGTGTRTLAFASNWLFPGGAVTAVLSTAAGSVDVITYFVRNDSTILASLVKAFA